MKRLHGVEEVLNSKLYSMSVRYRVTPRIKIARPKPRPPRPQKKVFTVSTKMTSRELVVKTLQKLYNIEINSTNEDFEVKVDSYRLEFEMSKDGCYDIRYSSFNWSKAVDEMAKEIESEYRGMLQDYIYNAVKAKAEEKGLALEQETVQKNQAIVLTFNLNG
ncbi:hypothetical protein CTE07_06450 [Chitinophaga terrae (ex Kim and Jung 2007)]|nr:hypothetical protein CTE07_06450 [Chitinophaga terrae (ex Kim and Jung 2007)]